MPVTVNDSSSSNSLFTGLALMGITAVNPTKAELATMGVNLEKDPQYVTEVESKRKPGTTIKQVRLELHYNVDPVKDVHEGFRCRASLFLKYEYVPHLYINKYGRFCSNFPKGHEKDTAEAREKWAQFLAIDPNPEQAFDGEMDLMMHLEAIYNVKKGNLFSLDKRKELFYYGYVGEVNKDLQKASKNRVWGLLGVQSDKNDPNKKYQTVFRRILPSWSTKMEIIHDAFQRQQEYITDTDFGPIKTGFSRAAMNLRQFGVDAPAAPASSSSAAATSPAPPAQPNPYATDVPAEGSVNRTEGRAPAPPAPIASDDDNDLPF